MNATGVSSGIFICFSPQTRCIWLDYSLCLRHPATLLSRIPHPNSLPRASLDQMPVLLCSGTWCENRITPALSILQRTLFISLT